MAMKTIKLGKLPVWIIVVIHIFHFGAGETFKWIKSGCSNYTFHRNSSPLYWGQSRKLCKKTRLGDLVSIESKAEWTFLKNTILNLTVADEYFIGLRKDDRSGQWGWLSNKNTSQTVLPWARFEPSGDGNCALMYKDYREDYGKYNDLGCITLARPGYICEFPVDGCKQEDNCQGVCLTHSLMPTSSTPSGTTKSTTQWLSDSSTVHDRTTASDSTATSSRADGSKGDNDTNVNSSTIVIVVASLAAVLFVVLIVLVVVLLLKRRKRRGPGKDEETPPKKSTHPPARLGEDQYEPVDRAEVAKLLGTSDNNKTEKKTDHESPPANCEYAMVNKKNKKVSGELNTRKEGDLVYAQLAEFDGANNDKTAQKPPSYEPTVYADVDVVPPKVFNSTGGDPTQPTYANVETTGV